MRVDIDDSSVECNVIYGKGEKITINIDSSGFITVKAPNNTREEIIANVIKQHGKLIKEKLDKISRFKDKFKEKSYNEEGKFLHLGKEYFLNELISVDGLSEGELKVNLKKFYTASLKKIAVERLKIYENVLGVKPKSIEVVESKTKWGSCTSDKKITFNYRLAMAPIEAIDYVVVHELCHIKHMNHDRSFWRLLGSVLPDYRKREEYLKRYGQTMTL